MTTGEIIVGHWEESRGQMEELDKDKRVVNSVSGTG